MLIGEAERVDESYRCPGGADVAHPYFFERELDHVPGVHLMATVADGFAVVPARLAIVQEGERIGAAALRLRCPVA